MNNQVYNNESIEISQKVITYHKYEMTSILIHTNNNTV